MNFDYSAYSQYGVAFQPVPHQQASVIQQIPATQAVYAPNATFYQPNVSYQPTTFIQAPQPFDHNQQTFGQNDANLNGFHITTMYPTNNFHSFSTPPRVKSRPPTAAASPVEPLNFPKKQTFTTQTNEDNINKKKESISLRPASTPPNMSAFVDSIPSNIEPLPYLEEFSILNEKIEQKLEINKCAVRTIDFQESEKNAEDCPPYSSPCSDLIYFDCNQNYDDDEKIESGYSEEELYFTSDEENIFEEQQPKCYDLKVFLTIQKEFSNVKPPKWMSHKFPKLVDALNPDILIKCPQTTSKRSSKKRTPKKCRLKQSPDSWSQKMKQMKKIPKEFQEEARINVHNILNKVTESSIPLFAEKLVKLLNQADKRKILKSTCDLVVKRIFQKASMDKGFGGIYCELIKHTLYSDKIERKCLEMFRDSIQDECFKSFTTITNETKNVDSFDDEKYYLVNKAKFIAILFQENLVKQRNLSQILSGLFKVAEKGKGMAHKEIALEIGVRCFELAKKLRKTTRERFLRQLETLKPLVTKRLQFLITDVMF